MNKFFKSLMVATSIAPIMLTYWFIEQDRHWNQHKSILQNAINNWKIGIGFLIATITLITLFYFIIKLATKRLEELKVAIDEIKTADNETLSFIFVYLLPVANGTTQNISIPTLIFVAVFFFLIVAFTNAYHFNPLINLLGYHFYEVKITGGITYLLLSRKRIDNSKSIKDVYLLTEYIILEKKLK